MQQRLDAARQALAESRGRLRVALVHSAEAHRRAAEVMDAQGHHERADWHRHAAEADFERADQLQAELGNT